MADFSFVADGHERACEAIRELVMQQYAERLATVTFFERIRLLCEIEDEVARRAEQEAPEYALY